MSVRFVPRFCVWLLVSAMGAVSSAEADWPAFLGGEARGAAAEYQPPLTWTTEQGIAWKVDLPGHGQSSPVVIGDHVYVTAVQGPMKEKNLVVCYSLESGKKRWQHDSASSLQVKNNVYTSRAAPTPAADEAGVYGFFESGNFVALDPEGNVRWQRDFIKDYGQYQGRFGLGGSLAQSGNRLIVLADNEGPSYLAAIDKSTGETIWKADRRSRTAWSSPVIIPVDGQPQIIISSAGAVDGYSVETGELLWRYDEVGGNTVASPVMVSDSTFLIGASPGRNGEASEGSRRSNLMMRIKKSDNGFQPEAVWINEKATSSFGSPIAHNGYAYYVNRSGVVYCLSLKSGETAFTARIAESTWATPIGIGDRVYFFGKGGVTTVLQAGEEKKELAENRLFGSAGGGGPGGFGGEIQYGVAALPDGFVVRTGTRLFRIRQGD